MKIEIDSVQLALSFYLGIWNRGACEKVPSARENLVR